MEGFKYFCAHSNWNMAIGNMENPHCCCSCLGRGQGNPANTLPTHLHRAASPLQRAIRKGLSSEPFVPQRISRDQALPSPSGTGTGHMDFPAASKRMQDWTDWSTQQLTGPAQQRSTHPSQGSMRYQGHFRTTWTTP